MTHVHRIGRRVSRRIFLADLGRGGVAAAVGIGLIACGGNDEDDPTAEAGEPTSTATSADSAASATTAATAAGTTAATATGSVATATSTSGADSGSELIAVEWERANLGNVSAYVLARNGEATIVDTGVPNSEAMIEAALEALGLGWDAVGHVVVTHLHGDHAGSLPAVLSAAPDAAGYAGAADIGGITSPRELVAVGDGDSVFGLEIIETPGHTAGHISVLDPVGGILVAGDAINGANGGVIGPNERFTPDMATANQSVSKLAGFSYGTILFGHGEPVLERGSEQVTALVS